MSLARKFAAHYDHCLVADLHGLKMNQIRAIQALNKKEIENGVYVYPVASFSSVPRQLDTN